MPPSLRFSLKGRLLRALLARRDATIVSVLGDTGRTDLRIVRETRARVPLLVGDGAALTLLACARSVRGLGGTMAEAGVYAGGTARLLCEVKGETPLRLFDVFDSLESDAQAGTGAVRADQLRRHFKDLPRPQAEVERLLSPYAAVYLHAGIFPESARGLEAERFSLVHLDLDLEPSTRDALEFFRSRMIPGGVIVGDDYQDPGVRRAFDAQFAAPGDAVIALPWGQVVVAITSDNPRGGRSV